MGIYDYKVYAIDSAGGQIARRYIQDVAANCPAAALKKARLDNWHSIKTRAGRGHTNTAIKVYGHWYEGRDKEPADFLLERIF